MSRTPNFAGWHALILHREDANTERLERQLGLLGMRTSCQWQPLAGWDAADLVLVDADQGWDDLLPARSGKAAKPLVALLASEAPGRIAWAMEQGASAIIPKPVTASAIYPALVLAVAIHQERIDAQARLDRLEERLRLRPVVYAAVEKLKAERRVDDEAAYAMLRNCAMRRRLPIEQIAAYFLGGSEPLREVG